MTRAELRSRVKGRLDSAGATPYTDAQVHDVLNEGLSLFAFLTLCVERKVELPLSADVPMWRMTERITDWIVPLRVRCRRLTSQDGSMWDIPLFDSTLFDEPVTVVETITRVSPRRLSELDALDPAWQLARDGTVLHYGCQGHDQFYIHPAPADANTSLQTTYAGEAFPLTADAESPEIPEEYQPALISYALATLPLRFGGSELTRFEGEFRLFFVAVRECADWIRARSKSLKYDTFPPELKLADLSRKPKPAERVA